MKEKKRSSISRLMGYAGGYKALTITGCTLSGISAVLSLLPYIFIWFVIRDVFAALPDLSGATGLTHYGWMAVAFAAASVLVYFAALMCTHLAAFRTARNMRQAAVEHIVTLPLGFFSGNQSGRLRKIIDSNADMTESLLAHQLPDLVGAVVTPVAAIALLFVFDWRLGLLSLVPMILSVYLMTLMMGGKNADFFSRYQIELEKMSSHAVEYVRGIPVLKVFQQTVYSFKSFYKAIMSYNKLATDYAMSCRGPMTAFTTALNGTFLLLIPAGMLLAGTSSDGRETLLNLIFYILFTPACAGMMNRIMHASEALMKADEAVRKLDQIMLEKPLKEADNPKIPQSNSIEFKNVAFTYPGASRPALRNVSFVIPQGSTAALVGPSGGGKTTAANLIPRFWDVEKGQVLVGGVDVREIRSEDLMSRVAFVFQDTHLFKASLLDNIRAARPEASRAEALRAAHDAQCDDILEKLPNGIDTVVGTKGVYLSGGEQQRIALARAILKDAPIIVLDEATAFADPENEYMIQKAFETLTKGKTVLMIAHRLSTVRNADKIIVLENGSLTEQGNHEELLAGNKLYSAMWQDYQKSAQWKVGKEVAGV
ncbi:MAG: ABC transporter ATP-binding protein [Clostridiales bacterium]|nr:ABC transporter ATP-binding protein [Clostridiales bacterium]